MINTKVCDKCSRSYPSHFFKDDLCIPCTFELTKPSEDEPTKEGNMVHYMEEESTCTSCTG